MTPGAIAAAQLAVDGAEIPPPAIPSRASCTPTGLGPRGPKGARIGDVVLAEGSRWQVRDLDLERREAICELLAGSHALRRFRARAIERVERSRRRRGRRARPTPDPAVDHA
jgi:hypothetical protein